MGGGWGHEHWGRDCDYEASRVCLDVLFVGGNAREAIIQTSLQPDNTCHTSVRVNAAARIASPSATRARPFWAQKCSECRFAVALAPRAAPFRPSVAMSDSASKGQELLSKAEKKMKGIALFGNKWEEASEMLEKAANHFKLAKLCACSPDTRDANEAERARSDAV